MSPLFGDGDNVTKVFSGGRFRSDLPKEILILRRRLLIEFSEPAIGIMHLNRIHSRIRKMLSPYSMPTIDKPRDLTMASCCLDPLRAVDVDIKHVARDMPLPDMQHLHKPLPVRQDRPQPLLGFELQERWLNW